MSARCSGIAISQLKLERYLLAELPAAERAHVDAHLEGCVACRAGLDELRASEITMPPLPAAPAVEIELPPRWPGAGRPLPTRAMMIGSGLALAAAALLALRVALAPPTPQAAVPADGVKGGELALELVRERGGDVARDPGTFADGDRFEALVSCAPGPDSGAGASRRRPDVFWELAVFQEGKSFFPLAQGSRLACGNAVQLPGAFLLTGTAPATICVLVARVAAIDRARITGSRPEALPFEHACKLVTPAER
jgi:hypothetical protein